MTKWFICVVSLLVYLAFKIFPCESQTTITAKPSVNWTEGSSATLTCTISAYSGLMKWKLGSTDVAKCTPNTCSAISTGEGAFIFGFDTTNHNFTWTFFSVKSSNNGNIFYCFDGTNTANYTATVQNITAATTPRPEDDQTAKIPSSVALLSAALALVVAIVIAIRCIRKLRANTIKQEEMDDGKMMTHLITEYLKEEENKKKLQPNKDEMLSFLKKKMEVAVEQNDRKEEESIMKCMPDQMIIEYSIEKYMKTDERMTQWLNSTLTIEKLVSGSLDKEKNDGPTSLKKANNAGNNTLKTDEKMTHSQNITVTAAIEKSLSEFLDKEKNDEPTSLDKEDMMKKFRSGNKTALYPLIEKYWDRYDTIKWLSDEKTIKRSIAECLEKLEEKRVQKQKEKCKNGENASGKQP